MFPLHLEAAKVLPSALGTESIRRLWKSFVGCPVFVLLALFVLCGIVLTLYLDEMGQTSSTPFTITMDHWTDIKSRAYNLSVEVKKRKWHLCVPLNG